MAERASPSKTHVGWIGTGVMGRSMVGHVRQAGYAVTVTSRTRERAAAALAAGATWADTPAEVATKADVIILMVGYPAEVRDVVQGPRGVFAGARPGAILVDMSTSEPSLARELALEGAGHGVTVLDAPVSGGDIGAREARLAIMVGGEAAAVEAVRPLLETMGKTITHVGLPGAGQHTKMVNQILIASGMVSLCEALLYAHRAGLDLETVMAAVGGGAAGSWSLANYGPRILKGNFDPGFFVEHFIKDMGIALAEAERMRLSLPGLALAHQLYLALRAQGHGKKGTQSLILALASLSGLEWKGTSVP